MFITKTKNLSVVPDVFVSGEILQVVSEYKYLGVLIDSKLSFKTLSGSCKICLKRLKKGIPKVNHCKSY